MHRHTIFLQFLCLKIQERESLGSLLYEMEGGPCDHNMRWVGEVNKCPETNIHLIKACFGIGTVYTSQKTTQKPASVTQLTQGGS